MSQSLGDCFVVFVVNGVAGMSEVEGEESLRKSSALDVRRGGGGSAGNEADSGKAEPGPLSSAMRDGKSAVKGEIRRRPAAGMCRVN